jgi:hypothetical protein
MSTNFRDIYVQHLEKQALVSFVMKSARCWAGYEPVPGKAPYSEDSCRPKGSKKKDKKPAAEKQAVNSIMPPRRDGKMPARPAAPPTQQIKPKPVKPTNSRQLFVGPVTADQKTAECDPAAASHFKHPKKELEPVVGGKKPSTENTKHHKVEPKLPSEGENLHPAASLLRPAAKPMPD